MIEEFKDHFNYRHVFEKTCENCQYSSIEKVTWDGIGQNVELSCHSPHLDGKTFETRVCNVCDGWTLKKDINNFERAVFNK